MGAARETMAVHRKSRDLLSIGAYQHGSNPQIDRAIQLHEPMNDFLQQDVTESQGREKSWDDLRAIVQTETAPASEMAADVTQDNFAPQPFNPNPAEPSSL